MEDNTPPVINSVTATPNCIRPCFGRLMEITVQGDANDVCDDNPTSQIIGVSSNQECRFMTQPDWYIINNSTVYLRAKKNFYPFDDRIYTITVQTTDESIFFLGQRARPIEREKIVLL